MPRAYLTPLLEGAVDTLISEGIDTVEKLRKTPKSTLKRIRGLSKDKVDKVYKIIKTLSNEPQYASPPHPLLARHRRSHPCRPRRRRPRHLAATYSATTLRLLILIMSTRTT